MSEDSPATFEQIYYADPLVCSGCKKKFCNTVRKTDSDETYCMICFGHKYSIDEMSKILKSLDPLARQLWEVPHDELTEELKSKLQYIVKPSDKK